MIDLHAHILPGVDDGAKDLETALAMARLGVEHGLRVLGATPHFYQIPQWVLIKEKTAELQRHFQEAEIELLLVPAAELLLDPQISKMDTQEIPTYGDAGLYCLLEFPFQQIPLYTEEVLFSLQARGITPIIAHPERYSAVLEDPNLVLKWIRQGLLIQMNTGSLLGSFGSRIQKTAEIMLKQGMVHLLGSDAHGPRHRTLNLHLGFLKSEALIGKARALQLVKTNPEAILKGQVLEVEEPREYKRKKRFLFF